MKHNKFMRLEEKCPKCHDHLTVEKKPFVETNQQLYKVGCHNCGAYGASVLGEEKAYAEFMKYMEKSDRIKIFSDIYKYLKGKLEEVRKTPVGLPIKATAVTILEAQIDTLKSYAEKLGVEL